MIIPSTTTKLLRAERDPSRVAKKKQTRASVTVATDSVYKKRTSFFESSANAARPKGSVYREVPPSEEGVVKEVEMSTMV